MGLGFDLETAYRSGLVVLGASGVLTLLSWILGYSLGSG